MIRRHLSLSLVLGLFMGIAAHPALGQTTAWLDQIATPEYEEAWTPLVIDGVVYVIGWTGGTLSGETSAGGGSDGFLRAYDVDGTEIWTTQFGTSAGETAWSLATDGTALYATGVTDGQFDGEMSAGGPDAYVAKFNLDGSLEWVTQFGTAKDDLGASVVADASGIYVSGSTRGALAGQTKHGRSDGFLSRLDADGTLDWTAQFGTAKDDTVNADALGPDGIYVNGYTRGDLVRPVRGETDGFVMLFQTDGSMSWTRQIGGREDQNAVGLVADAAGVYVTGFTNGALRDQRNHGGWDVFAMLLSSANGTRIWSRQFGTKQDDFSYGAALSGGTLYPVGETWGGLAHQASAGDSDAFVQAMNAASGVRDWTYQFGTRRTDSGLAAWSDGTAICVGGITEGTFEGATRGGGGDAFVSRVDLP